MEWGLLENSCVAQNENSSARVGSKGEATLPSSSRVRIADGGDEEKGGKGGSGLCLRGRGSCGARVSCVSDENLV